MPLCLCSVLMQEKDGGREGWFRCRRCNEGKLSPQKVSPRHQESDLLHLIVTIETVLQGKTPMAFEGSSRSLSICSRCLRNNTRLQSSVRSFSTTSRLGQEPTIEPGDGAANTHPPPPDARKPRTPPSTRANLVHTPASEQRLMREHNISPIGSRRRRAAIASSTGIPFHQLPYQCFQEARKIILQDRKEKVSEIEKQRDKIERLKVHKVEGNDVAKKEHRVRTMEHRLKELKILADINDPVVKKKFEDGLGTGFTFCTLTYWVPVLIGKQAT